ncbi:hypothetical protein IAI10_24010 [Clostridium sp. 19966]|uniref:hypothetical protein n=1 Tax=Clostridium sp. 19966 TaxID=2768166 RepID=UPI0028DFD130|nr:hypothetical protein [Clostridium sp. 19966]MDT8719705.1 hypothetical protein [Clostridium sp. 19966]
MQWIINNAHWIFEGIGGIILTLLVGLFTKRQLDKKTSQKIKSGKNSTNVQGGGNVTVTIGGKKND